MSGTSSSRPGWPAAALWVTGMTLFLAMVRGPGGPVSEAHAAEAAPQVTSKSTPVPLDPLDWYRWRGPEQNGISRETGLVDSWDPAGGPDSNLLWKRPELGTISTPIVLRGKLYLLCRHLPGTNREGEKVVCIDAASGASIWENTFNVYLSDVPDTRVAWSSVVGDPQTGQIYAQGVCGYFQCLDGETGKTVWSRSLSEEFGALSTYGGRTNVPIVFEDLVIVSAVMTGWGDYAVPAHRFIGMDKATGEVRWINGTRLRPEDTTYSTPTLTVINGQALLVFGSGDGALYAMQPRTGKIVWKYQFSRRGLNVSPVVTADGKVYTGHSEENMEDNTMGALAAIDGTGMGDITATGTLWKLREKTVGKSSPLLLDGRVYAVDDSASFWVVDAAKGELIGKKRKLGSMMRSSPLYADGKIFATETNGRVWILKPSDAGLDVVHRVDVPGDANLVPEECQGSPIVSHGRIYIPTTGHLYCLGRADAKPSATPQPTLPVESAVEDQTPAQVQVLPAEVLLRPGDQQAFRVRLFNARGQLVSSTATPTFSVDAAGEIDAQGRYAAQNTPSHAASIVTVSVGELKGTARVRIVPPLPWNFDFVDAQVPITWIGARYRHQTRDMEGNPALVKVTTIPKGTRSQSWMGPIGLHDYTVQADVRGAIKNGKLPDMGIIAQRYTLDLMGQSQQLQIRTWTAMLEARMGKTIPFAWKPDTWYTLKLSASIEKGQAVLRGKVWPRDAAEPAEWMVEAVDQAPNLMGSPGLFGNANDAEIFVDNVRVLPNAATPQ